MNNHLYTKDSIESLSQLEFTRLKPQVYAGDTTYSTQLLIEILSNAVDEFRLGHGNKILISLLDDNVIRVQDFGQGFMINEKREDGKTILEAAFSVLNTSGKYRDDGAYEGTSLGNFGIGSKITNFLANWLDVVTYRGKQYEHIWFKEGVFDKRETGAWDSETTGTVVTWKPSSEFFTHPEVELNVIKELIQTITCLCPGLTIELDNHGKKESFYSKHGLNDLVDNAIGDKEILSHRCELHSIEGKNKMDFLLTYTSNYSSTIVPYVNTGLTERGPHVSQIKSLITREFNKFFREKKWLKEKDENLTGDDIQEGMYIVFNLTAPNVKYSAQIKNAVIQIDMAPFLKELTVGLQSWLYNNEKEIKVIADKALSARRAREAARKAREKARQGNKKKQKVLKFDSKLADCNSKDRTRCEIYITEGK